MEQWDLYSKDRVRTGKKIFRGEKIPQGFFRMVVHICIFNKEGKMLIQQRQVSKNSFPDKWDVSVGGCVVAGESGWQAAQREVMEELGISINLENQRPHLSINFDNGFDDYYIIEQELDLNSLQLQQEEVQKVVWATPTEIHAMLDDLTFIPYHESLIDLLFAMKETRDSRSYQNRQIT